MGKLRSLKSGHSYEADSVTARLEKRQGTSGSGFTLTINGIPILQWFRLQFDKLTKPNENGVVRRRLRERIGGGEWERQ